MAFGGNAGVTQVLMKFMGDASHAISSMKGFDQKFNATMQGMRRYGLATFTAVTGSLTAMAMSTAKLGDHFQKMSMQTGISTETLSAWRFVAEQSGSSVEALEKGVLRMSRGMMEAAQGVGEYADTYKHLGVEVTNADGTLRSAEDVLADVADRFMNMKDGTEKAALAQELFGRAGAELIPMLNLGRDGIKELTDEAHRLGITFDQEAADASAAFNDRLNELKLSFSGIKNQIGLVVIEAVTPYIEKIKEAIVQVVAWMREHKELIAGIVKVLGVLGGTGGLLAMIGFIGPAIAGAVAMLTGPVGMIVALAALATAMGLLIDRYIPGFLEGLGRMIRDAGIFYGVIDAHKNTLDEQLANIADDLEKFNDALYGLRNGTMSLAEANEMLNATWVTEDQAIKGIEDALRRLVDQGDKVQESIKNQKTEAFNLEDILNKLKGTTSDTTGVFKKFEEQTKDNIKSMEDFAFSTMDYFTRGLPIWTIAGMQEWTKYSLWMQGETEEAVKEIDKNTYTLLMMRIPGFLGLSMIDWSDYSKGVSEAYDKDAADKMEKRTDNLFNTFTKLMTDWKNKSWKDWLGDIIDLFGWSNPHGAIGEMSKNYSGFLDFMSKAGSTWLGAESGLKGFLDNFKKAFGDMLKDLAGTFDNWLKGLGSSLASFLSTMGEFFSWLGFISWLMGFSYGGPGTRGPGSFEPWDYEGSYGVGGTKGGTMRGGFGGGASWESGLPGEPKGFQRGGIIPEYIRGIGASGRRYEFHGPGETVVPNKFLGGITVNINYPMLLNRGAIQQVTNAVQRELTNNIANMGLVNFSGAT